MRKVVTGYGTSKAILKNVLLLNVLGCFACVSVHQVHAVPYKASRGHQIPLELELQMVVSSLAGGRNQTQVSWKSSQCS